MSEDTGQVGLDEAVGGDAETSESADGTDKRLITGVAWSEISNVPEDWEVNNIESDIEIQTGDTFSSEEFDEEEGIPLIRIRDLGENETETNYVGEYDDMHLIENFDLLVGMDGEFEPHFWLGGAALLNQRVCKIEPKSEYNNFFLRYAMEKPLLYIQKSIAGTTVKHLSQKNINRVNLPTPPLSEQRKIASVLYNVDEAIRKTEEIIEQTKRVKNGVMQDVFTEGYFDHDATKEGTIRWKQVPSSWNLPKLHEVAEVNPSYEESAEMADYIEMDAVDTTLPEPRYIGKRNPSDYSGRLFTEGDTLFARITPCTENGKICFVDDIESDVGIGSTEYAVLSPSDKILPRYLYHYSRTHQVRDYAISRMRGSTGRQRVPFDVFRKELHIPLPPKREQSEIVDLLDSLDGIIRNTRKGREQFKRLKSALMQDLLTGDVRTQDRDIEVLPEVEAHG